jgi:GNAT superfamily N-acetyltransferase
MGARYKATPRWTWQFSENPFWRRHGDEVPVWVATDGARVVGQIAVQHALVQVGGERFEAGWAVDIIVLPSYRGRGIGHRLHAAVVKDVDVLASLAMAPAARRLAEGCGCVTLADVYQLTRWVRLDAASVRRYLLVRTANRRWTNWFARTGCNLLRIHVLLPSLANPLLRLRDFAHQLQPAPTATTIVEVDCFGSEVDELWERTRGDYAVIVPRDARFLNWRFVECPEPRYRRFVARRRGRVVGYVVLRHAEPVELPEGIIVDLYASRHDTETLDALVRHSLAFFGATVAAVECGTSVAEIKAVLRQHGFFKTRTHRPTCICRDSALRRHLEQLRNDCFFSKGDHDWDHIYVTGPDAASE